MGIFLFILALLVVIMVHEAGHFTAAKLLGFKATKFFVGFGPTLWSVTRGETEYGVKAIPAGGFVKILGMNPYEEVPPEDEARSYPNKPRWQRAIVIIAGARHALSSGLLGVGVPLHDLRRSDPHERGGRRAGRASGKTLLRRHKRGCKRAIRSSPSTGTRWKAGKRFAASSKTIPTRP